MAPHETITDPSQVYLALTLEARAINLAMTAPHNTIQLEATPRDGRDSVMIGLPAPTFHLVYPSDTAVLRVTTDGQVTALAVGSQIPVVAELTAPGPVRHADTALISVTAVLPPALASLSIAPIAPDSAVWPMGADQQSFILQLSRLAPQPALTPQALDATGQPMNGLVIEYTSLDPAIATVDQWTGQVHPRRPGSVRMVARTTAYGVAATDTVLFRVTWPMEGTVWIEATSGGASKFEADEVRIRSYGIVLWDNFLSDPVDVTFDDPTNVVMPPASLCVLFQFIGVPDVCGVGNMVVSGPDPNNNAPINWRIRQFPIPGVYTYHSTRTGTTGRIVVTDEVPGTSGP